MKRQQSGAIEMNCIRQILIHFLFSKEAIKNYISFKKKLFFYYPSHFREIRSKGYTQTKNCGFFFHLLNRLKNVIVTENQNNSDVFDWINVCRHFYSSSVAY